MPTRSSSRARSQRAPAGRRATSASPGRRTAARSRASGFRCRPGADTASFVGYCGDGFRVLAEHPHSRKLRRGALAGNRFRIRVRGLQGDRRGDQRAHRAAAGVGRPQLFRHAAFRQGGREPPSRPPVARDRPAAARPGAAGLRALVRARARLQRGARRARASQHLESPAAGRDREPGRQPVRVRRRTSGRRAAAAPARGRHFAHRAALRCRRPAAGRRGRPDRRRGAGGGRATAGACSRRSACAASGARSCCGLPASCTGSRRTISSSSSSCRAARSRRACCANSSTCGCPKPAGTSARAGRTARPCRRRCGVPSRTRARRHAVAASD